MGLKKVISLLMILIFLFTNAGVIAADGEDPNVYLKKTSFSNQVIKYLLNDLNIISEDYEEITRGDCLEIIVNLKNMLTLNKPEFYTEESLIARLKLRKKFPIADWDSLTLEEKNILDAAMTRSVFYGEEKDGELYANFDEPITYYEALSFLLRWYYDQCLLLWRIDSSELNQNWLDYAESTGILYGRIPDYVDKCAVTIVKIPKAEKERIRRNSQEIVPPEEFYGFLWNMLMAPTYYDEFTRLWQDSMINKVFERRLYEEGKWNEG